jgi:hypothetical protein
MVVFITVVVAASNFLSEGQNNRKSAYGAAAVSVNVVEFISS